MPFTETGFSGLLVFEPKVFPDSRGYFFESYNETVCHAAGIDTTFIQDNQAASEYGVIRGLHYQAPPYAQAKFIRVLSGAILDAVVDLRSDSATFGKIYSIELSAENKLQLFIPRGFAHGYSVISDTAEVFYKVDNKYDKSSEGGLMYNDDILGIDWRIEKEATLVSEKDSSLLSFHAFKKINPF